MDSGIKIAILIACVLSLGLGVVWDKVIDGAREVIEPAKNTDTMAPDNISAKISAPARLLDEPALPTELPGSISEESGEGSTADRSEGPIRIGLTPNTTSAPVNNQGAPASMIDPDKISPETRKLLRDGKYIVQNGDSWWKIANVRFDDKIFGSSDNWKSTNSQNKGLQPGDLLNIPAMVSK